jgi:hypothetical protein
VKFQMIKLVIYDADQNLLNTYSTEIQELTHLLNKKIIIELVSEFSLVSYIDSLKLNHKRALFLKSLEAYTIQIYNSDYNVYIILSAKNLENEFAILRNISRDRLFHKTKLVSLVTATYKADLYLSTFMENCTKLINYDLIEHFICVSDFSKTESEILTWWLQDKSNIIIVWNLIDPGLYECWNKVIKISSTDFISNANVDDLRDVDHVKILYDILSNNSKYDFAATGVFAFNEFPPNLDVARTGVPWFTDRAGKVDFFSLANLVNKESSFALEPQNLPHCMPMWRKSLHEKFGYFDESRYGTYSDWYFWLKITSEGSIGYLHGEAKGFYYVNLLSHNRRGNKLKFWHKSIEKKFINIFKNYYDNKSMIQKRNLKKFEAIDRSNYGEHRNDFNRVVESLEQFSKINGDIKFIPFMEKYFVWGMDVGEASSSNPMPILKNWVGILHVPFDAPDWFYRPISPEVIFTSELWRNSKKYCRGIITLSEDLKIDVQNYLPDVAVHSVLHPTELFDLKPFNYDEFANNLTLIQVGDWLRKLQAIYLVKNKKYKKIMLTKNSTQTYLSKEIEVFGSSVDDSVQVMHMVNNQMYDELLSKSVVLCWLYATAANNVVLECIARNTPLLINPLPSVVEYLGSEYPLYFRNLQELEDLLMDSDAIYKATIYLSSLNVKKKLNYEYFSNSLSKSSFYQSL